MRKRSDDALFGNLTAMIDVVFQIIIFFVATSSMQDSAIDTRIELAAAPHGQAVKKKDPLEILVNVSSRGVISIGATPVDTRILYKVLKKAVKEYGNTVPVIIRGDGRASHQMIRSAMDTCASAGIWKIKIAAVKEEAKKPK